MQLRVRMRTMLGRVYATREGWNMRMTEGRTKRHEILTPDTPASVCNLAEIQTQSQKREKQGPRHCSAKLKGAGARTRTPIVLHSKAKGKVGFCAGDGGGVVMN